MKPVKAKRAPETAELVLSRACCRRFSVGTFPSSPPTSTPTTTSTRLDTATAKLTFTTLEFLPSRSHQLATPLWSVVTTFDGRLSVAVRARCDTAFHIAHERLRASHRVRATKTTIASSATNTIYRAQPASPPASWTADQSSRSACHPLSTYNSRMRFYQKHPINVRKMSQRRSDRHHLRDRY